MFRNSWEGKLTNVLLQKILVNKIESGSIIFIDMRSNYKTILKMFIEI